jgi:hypothetical protein
MKKVVIFLSVLFFVSNAAASIRGGLCISVAGGVGIPKRHLLFANTWGPGPSFGVSIGTLQSWFWKISVSGFFEYDTYRFDANGYRKWYHIAPDSTPSYFLGKPHRDIYYWGAYMKFSPLWNSRAGRDDQAAYPYILAGVGSGTLSKIGPDFHDDKLPQTRFSLVIGVGADFITGKHTAVFLEGKYYFFIEKVESLNLHLGIRWDFQ